MSLINILLRITGGPAMKSMLLAKGLKFCLIKSNVALIF
jgi:hypothetical protein